MDQACSQCDRKRMSEEVRELLDGLYELRYQRSQDIVETREEDGSEVIYEDPQESYMLSRDKLSLFG